MKVIVSILLLAGLVLGVACAAENTGVMTNNVVIVLDASGSMEKIMSGTSSKKMDEAKSALKEVLSQVPADTQIGLLVFDASGEKGWRFPLGARDDVKIRKAIDQTKAGGGTPLGRFVALGAEALIKQRRKQMGYGTYRLLVVTDGEAGDPQLLQVSVPFALGNGIRLDVIGVDMAGEHTLAKSAHSYRRADDPQSLKKAVADVFAELSGASSGNAATEAFDELAGIPDETAEQMIRALTLELKKQPLAVNTKSAAGKSSIPAQPFKNMKKEGGIGWWKYIIALVVFIILRSTFGKKKK